MLEVARTENSNPKITYLNMPMEEHGVTHHVLSHENESAHNCEPTHLYRFLILVSPTR